MSKSNIKTKTVLTITDMTESTELQDFGTVYWHKSLQFVNKSNKTLLPCLSMVLLAVSIIILRLGITF